MEADMATWMKIGSRAGVCGCAAAGLVGCAGGVHGPGTVFEVADMRTPVQMSMRGESLAALEARMNMESANLANVDTPGYKAGVVVQETGGDAGPRVAGVMRDMSAGAPMRWLGGVDSLGLMISGEGFFQIEVEGGSFAYTRDGRFTLSADGEIVTAAGGHRLQPPIAVPTGWVMLGCDAQGYVTVQMPGEKEPGLIGQIALVRFASAQGLMTTNGVRFMESAASGPPIMGQPGENGFGELVTGMCEGSNVDPEAVGVEVKRIRIARSFWGE
jgi:flagellar basal-body rod protein FlgG